ncbi:hypothetical protein AVEN_272306-1 [Araneus ventricosus]|uniref:DNA-directed DNA polymerase n=1 Tax=Araneus ventricosus TaxID=182803 RepID=A0A4Y2RB37_ARAVE|nr:hypothetical protein AVEN_272306-1 [Araneus ventricosus]
MKGFDGQFIMAWMLQQRVAPGVIPNGSKLMLITLTALNIKIIDSFNFLPMALSKLPSCFGLSEIKKGFFPHLFNIRDNQQFVGPFPDVKYFSPDQMSSKARIEFLGWYEAQKGGNFDFQAEMLSYCRSDVDILRRCCIEFRKQFIEIADVDPSCYVTIASACMTTFRAKHLEKDTIAMVPIHGYVDKTKFSHDAIRWLDYVALKENISIKHGMNQTGEQIVNGISVDGYCDETKTIYQFHGCFFHGCPDCFDGDALNLLLGLTMNTLFENTKALYTKLQKAGHVIVEKDAFFGGRTNAVKLYYEGEAKYVDFTSLYPWVNKYCMYPVGHPEIITDDFGSIDEYFGLAMCKVLPPRGLYLPVLPIRCKGKLMFPLCNTCVESLNQNPCTHNDEERAIIGTWMTEEIKLAVRKGYQVAKIYEVYHFSESSTSLFKTYIDTFLKIKQESSGYPAERTTDVQKDVQKMKEGVKLDAANISKNPGRRQVAKLALNSFWGRFGMNVNKTQLTYVHTLPQFNKLLADPTKNIKDIYLPTEEVAAIVWENKKQFIPQDTTTNAWLPLPPLGLV